jgi:hypothetical protein
VTLIPSLSEYKAAGIFDCLWFNKSELALLHVQLGYELNTFMLKYNFSDKRLAFKALLTCPDKLFDSSPQEKCQEIWAPSSAEPEFSDSS